MSGETSGHLNREGLEKQLAEWGIETTTIEHPEAFTVEEALPYVSHLDGMFAKNLFLRDKKKRNLYLFCAAHDADMKLNDLARITAAQGGMRFADEDVLKEKLGLTHGSVTLFGLINDKKKEVKLLLDRRFSDNTYNKIYFHPMVNSATTGLTPEALMKFLGFTGHKPLLIEIPEQS